MFVLWRKVGDAVESEEESFIYSHSQVTVGIQNFALLKLQGSTIESSTFVGDPKYGDQWKVEFHHFSKNSAQATLQLVHSESQEVFRARFQMCLLKELKYVDAAGSNCTYNTTFNPGHKAVCTEKWTISHLIDPAKGFLVGNSVFFNVNISTRRAKMERKSQAENKSCMTQQLKSFLMNEDFADVVLASGNSRFPASKIILAAQSPVFFVMFKSEMLESQSNAVVKIEDFTDETVKGFLEFIYTGKLESLEENAGELLKISNKYQVMSLKEKCENILLKNLKVENAVDILVLAHLHSSENLKPKIIPFVNKHFNELKNTASYGRVKKEYPQIVCDLYEAIQEFK